jgi:predicted extracellular nuclease
MAGRGGSGGTFEAGRAAGGQSGQAGGGQAGQASAGAGGSLRTHAVYFSEYVEGSSSYKALELAAREDSTLTGCRLATYFNGATMATGITLEGSLTAGSTYVLCSSGLGPVLETVCARTTNLTFNGDDAVALECDGTVLDVIGQIGVDPGDAWTNGETSTLNQTLRRRCTASLGDRDGSNAFDPAAEWAALPIDTFDGLGAAECPIDESR